MRTVIDFTLCLALSLILCLHWWSTIYLLLFKKKKKKTHTTAPWFLYNFKILFITISVLVCKVLQRKLKNTLFPGESLSLHASCSIKAMCQLSLKNTARIDQKNKSENAWLTLGKMIVLLVRLKTLKLKSKVHYRETLLLTCAKMWRMGLILDNKQHFGTKRLRTKERPQW